MLFLAIFHSSLICSYCFRGFGAVFSGKVPVGKRKERVAIKKLPHHSERVMENNLSESKFFDVLEGVRINFCAKKLKEARVALVLCKTYRYLLSLPKPVIN